LAPTKKSLLVPYRYLTADKIGDSPTKQDMKLGQQTQFGAKSQSEGTIQLVSKPGKMARKKGDNYSAKEGHGKECL